MPFEKGQSGNVNGRPINSKNKINPQEEISKAMASGMSLQEMVIWLSDKITIEPEDEKLKITDAQKTKYLVMLIDLKKFLSKEDLARVPNPNKETSKIKPEVKNFPRAIFKNANV